LVWPFSRNTRNTFGNGGCGVDSVGDPAIATRSVKRTFRPFEC
jgi:hypothetical protein